MSLLSEIDTSKKEDKIKKYSSVTYRMEKHFGAKETLISNINFYFVAS